MMTTSTTMTVTSIATWMIDRRFSRSLFVRRPPITAKKLNEMKRLVGQGLRYTDVARRLGIHPKTVSYWMGKSGVRKFDGERMRAEIRRLYGKKMRPTQICRHLGISSSTLRYHRAKLNLPGVAKREALRRAGAATLRNGTHHYQNRSLAVRNQNERAGFPWCTGAERHIIEYLCEVGETTVQDYAMEFGRDYKNCHLYFKRLARMQWALTVMGLPTGELRRYVLSPRVVGRLRLAGREVKDPVGVKFKRDENKEDFEFSAHADQRRGLIANHQSVCGITKCR